ncbi:hypothetical protein BKA82DRAFT_4099141, partial [Pisolithus tinctorius]
MGDVDSLLRLYHSGIQRGEPAVSQKEALERLLRQHREAAARESADSLPTSASSVRLHRA